MKASSKIVLTRTFHVGIVANSVFAVYNFRLDLIKKLQQEGYRVTVLAPSDGFAHLLLREGVHLESLPLITYNKNPIWDIRDMIKLWNIYGQLYFDFIFHYTIKPNTFGTLAACMRGVPSIAVVTGTGNLFLERNRLVRNVMQWLYRVSTPFSKETWFLNTADRDAFVKQHLVRPHKVRLIPGEGVNTDYYAPRPKPLSQTSRVFLFIGRLIAEKGIREFVEAARIIKLNYPNTVFQILGYVENKHPSAIPMEELETWVKEHIVDYLGGSTNIRPFIAQCDTVVLPSYTEGMNRVLLEAASMAKPLIASDVPGCREIVIPSRTGWLVKPRHLDSLAAAMEDCLATSPVDLQIMGSLGRAHVCKHYPIEAVHKIYLETLAHYLEKSAIKSIVRKRRPSAFALWVTTR
jgi:glycosyltransferase involved in cell wall biosynthesis